MTAASPGADVPTISCALRIARYWWRVSNPSEGKVLSGGGIELAER